MREDKKHIFALRQGGKSYREIQKITGISRGTLTKWFANADWSKHITARNIGAQPERAREQMAHMRMVRKLTLQYRYAQIAAEAKKEYETYKNHPLFWAGLMVYAGAGEKRSKGYIRITSAEMYPHRIFIQFACRYLGIEKETFRHGVLLHEGMDEVLCRTKWTEKLAIQPNRLYKTQFLAPRKSPPQLQYGIGMSIISSTALKKKLVTWLTLAQDEQFEQAAMV